MSTRSIIMVVGAGKYSSPNQVYRLYKHSDGYPTDNLRIIGKALSQGEMMLAEERDDINNINTRLLAETMVGLIIGAATTVYGMGAKIDRWDDDNGVYSGPLKREHLGCQGDLEWIYVVNTIDKTVKVYGGDHDDVMKGRTVDPLSYVNCLVQECRKSEREEILKTMKAIETAGYKINP